MEPTLRIIKKIIPRPVLRLLRPAYHFFLAFAAAVFYGFPARRLIVIGVTGTKGKTTVVSLLHSIFEKNGASVASLSSLSFRIDKKEITNTRKMTMPGRFFIQRFLHKAARAGVTHVIMEVTSEGIAQHRHRFIPFAAAVMTNIAPEHIESHGSFEAYVRAKLDLFSRVSADGLAVINRGDSNAERFAASTHARKIFYDKDGIYINGNSWRIENVSGSGGVSFFIAPGFSNGAERVRVSSALRGEFQASNMIASVACALGFGISLKTAAKGIEEAGGVPGRMEYIQEEPFAVVVDYAHTPDSLKNVYTFLSENSKIKTQNAKLICVLGAAGGGRDKWKRPEFGRLAAEFCDEIILTNEDPYDEDPQDIIKDIESGIPTSYKLQATSCLDRRAAIREALVVAKEGDTVVITGKGAEPWIMGRAGSRTPWDDRQVVRDLLAELP